MDNLLKNIINKSNYIIDIGATDGPGPVYDYFKNQNYDGLCVEAYDCHFTGLCKNLPQSNISKHKGFITPENVLNIFETYNVPQSPDIFKIDIDGYDLSVIRKVLEKYSPKIIVCEINEKIPPPIYFETKYTPDFMGDSSHFYGFSLQAAYDVLAPLDYVLVKIQDFNNLICVHKNYNSLNIVQESPQVLYHRDYSSLSFYYHLPWNRDVNHWLKIQDPKLLMDDIIDYFTTSRKQRGRENLGVPIKRDKFECRITN
jgi:hypothetical protein